MSSRGTTWKQLYQRKHAKLLDERKRWIAVTKLPMSVLDQIEDMKKIDEARSRDAAYLRRELAIADAEMANLRQQLIESHRMLDEANRDAQHLQDMLHGVLEDRL